MTLLGYHVTAQLILVGVLHLAGIWVLYSNRKDLLYDNEDKDISTPNTLSMGRCWSWLLFYLAFSYWLRYVMGEIPYSTPFPPGLQEMLYACLLYEFAKKGVDVSSILLRNRQQGPGNYPGGYPGDPYGQPYGPGYGNSPYPPGSCPPNEPSATPADAPAPGTAEAGPPSKQPDASSLKP